jgi:hypothetical protein
VDKAEIAIGSFLISGGETSGFFDLLEAAATVLREA